MELDEELKKLVFEGAAARWGAVSESVRERLETELGICTKLELAGYFLLVKKLVDVIRAGGGFVAAGRDSSCSWAISHALGLNDIDPIAYEIPGERFLYDGIRVNKWTPCICIDVDQIGKKIGDEFLVMKVGAVREEQKDPLHPAIYDLGEWSVGLTCTDTADRLSRLSKMCGIAIDDISMDDPKAMKLLLETKLEGIDYFNNERMRYALRSCKKLDIRKLTHLYSLAASSYSDSLEKYVRMERCATFPRCEHPLLDEILIESRGIVVFDDQMMVAMKRLAGFTIKEARTGLKVLSKRMVDQGATYRDKFVKGCCANLLFRTGAYKAYRDAADYAGRLWDRWFENGYFAFMKAHCIAFARQSVQLAFFKANFPEEWSRLDDAGLNNNSPRDREK